MFFGEGLLTCPAAAERVDQSQAGTEVRIGTCCNRYRRIQGLKHLPASLAHGSRPDRDRVEVGVNQLRERQRGVGRGHTWRHAAANRRERVAKPVQHELSDGVADGNAVSAKEAACRDPSRRIFVCFE